MDLSTMKSGALILAIDGHDETTLRLRVLHRVEPATRSRLRGELIMLLCSCWHVMPPNRWRYLAEIVEACAVCGWILTHPTPEEG